MGDGEHYIYCIQSAERLDKAVCNDAAVVLCQILAPRSWLIQHLPGESLPIEAPVPKIAQSQASKMSKSLMIFRSFLDGRSKELYFVARLEKLNLGQANINDGLKTALRSVFFNATPRRLNVLGLYGGPSWRTRVCLGDTGWSRDGAATTARMFVDMAGVSGLIFWQNHEAGRELSTGWIAV